MQPTKTIICDTRQKVDKNAHIQQQLEDLGYRVIRSKLLVGDYSWATNQSVCVDTKANMNEVESNLVHDHSRFRDECIRANDAGIKLVVLIQDQKLTKLSDVYGWFNVRRKWSKQAVTGKQLAKMMQTMSDRYNVSWQFTKREHCGKRILELLEGNNDLLGNVERN